MALTRKQRQKKFRPYAVELGEVIYTWNRLQESLASMFWHFTRRPDDLWDEVGLAIWYSTPNDRTQREMLRAAVRASGRERAFEKYPEAQEDIYWLLNKCNSFADKRNDAIHSPYMIWPSKDEAGKWDYDETVFTGGFLLGNPRAKKLEGKDLLAEFKWYSEYADELLYYSNSIRECLNDPRKPWPEKPVMPHLGQSPTRTKARRKTTPK
jgi:hypothetical protein